MGLPYGQTDYAASKAGLIALTRCLAHEVGSRTITVNAVAPGIIPNEINAKMPDEIAEWIAGMTRSSGRALGTRSRTSSPSWPRTRRATSPARRSAPTGR